MRFSLFYELQLPRPWNEHSEQRLFDEALEQIRLADKLGFHCVWAVEHHFLEEYAHSAASAVWLAAAAAQTEKIRIGLGIMPLPPGFQHPARVAEAVATLDLISHGRVELGTGETSSDMELGGFDVHRSTKRAEWEESLGVVTRMMTETPFTGHHGRFIRVPERNVIPKPRQKPHPPLWVACSQRETIRMAARQGLGALSFSFSTPDEAKAWAQEYYELIASDESVPTGFAANANFAIALPMHVHADKKTAKARGGEGARFFGYALAHYYAFGDHKPGVTDIYAEFKRDGDRVELGGSGDTTSAIGTPQRVAQLTRAYEEAGVDEMLLAVQVGATKHEHIMESLELFAKEVMPEFAERQSRIDDEKAQRLAEPLRQAMARRADAPPASRHHVPPKTALATARKGFGFRAESALKSIVVRASDKRLEQIAGSSLGLKTIFKVMESRYVPANANGFDGELQYDLRYGDGRVVTWSIALDSHEAKVRRGPASDPALAISATIADFVRMGTGELAPAKALLTGRINITGDLVVAARLGEMFGQQSAF